MVSYKLFIKRLNDFNMNMKLFSLFHTTKIELSAFKLKNGFLIKLMQIINRYHNIKLYLLLFRWKLIFKYSIIYKVSFE